MTQLQQIWLGFLAFWFLSGMVGTTFIIASFKLVWDKKHQEFELNWLDFLFAFLTTLCGPVCLSIGLGMFIIGKSQK